MNSKKRRVRKGLETPLIISGVGVREYYLLLICCGIVGFYLFGELNNVLDKLTLASLINWLVKAAVSGSLLLFIRWRLVKLSNQKKYRFKNIESTISNRDIFHYLKKPKA